MFGLAADEVRRRGDEEARGLPREGSPFQAAASGCARVYLSPIAATSVTLSAESMSVRALAWACPSRDPSMWSVAHERC